MQPVFQRIALLGKSGKTIEPAVAETIRHLSSFLKAQDLQVLLDSNTARHLPDLDLPTADHQQIGEQADLAIVVGGDGTMLNAARSLCHYTLPLVGINLGRLGFLADISPDNMAERMEEILTGHYQLEERFLLQTTIFRNGECIGESQAFNDVVVHKWNMARMIEFDTFVNDRFITEQRSDGLIVSTPTGSTAYALSGGGPLLHPTLEAVVLVPICPHTLSNRPIVVNSDSRISIFLTDCSYDHAQLACDGQINVALMEGDHIHIRRKDNPVRLIHPATHDHFQLLRAKLGWG